MIKRTTGDSVDGRTGMFIEISALDKHRIHFFFYWFRNHSHSPKMSLGQAKRLFPLSPAERHEFESMKIWPTIALSRFAILSVQVHYSLRSSCLLCSSSPKCRSSIVFHSSLSFSRRPSHRLSTWFLYFCRICSLTCQYINTSRWKMFG